jgi:hypothetical protein
MCDGPSHQASVNAEAVGGLIADKQAISRGATDVKALAPLKGPFGWIIGVWYDADHSNAPPKSPTAAHEAREMVRVTDVVQKHPIAPVKKTGEVISIMEPDAPVVEVLISDTAVSDMTEFVRAGFVYSPRWLNVETSSITSP